VLVHGSKSIPIGTFKSIVKGNRIALEEFR